MKARFSLRSASPPPASDLDVVYRCGYGFPDEKGSPMFYADEYGLAQVIDTME